MGCEHVFYNTMNQMGLWPVIQSDTFSLILFI